MTRTLTAEMSLGGKRTKQNILDAQHLIGETAAGSHEVFINYIVRATPLNVFVGR